VRVRNLVTFGSQHDGIAKYQVCGATDWLCKSYIGLLKANTWGTWVQGHVVPAQYFKQVDEETGEPGEDYLEKSNFLASVNNEREVKNAVYKRNLAALDNFVMLLFRNDTTVVPKESGWFSYVNATSGEVTGVRERRIYKEDWIGLRALDEKGGLHFEEVEGEHMELDEGDLKAVFEKWFSVERGGWSGHDQEEEEEEVIEL